MPGNFLVILTTLPSAAQARQISKRLIQKKLAACVNVLGPAQSFFRWEGKIDKVREYLLVIKTRASHFDKLSAFLKTCHPYLVPEIVALPILKGNLPYLNWIKDSVR